MKLWEILRENKYETGTKFKMTIPDCGLEYPAYSEWKGSIFRVISNSLGEVVALVWVQKPNVTGVGDEFFVDLCGMVIQSEWEQVNK